MRIHSKAFSKVVRASTHSDNVLVGVLFRLGEVSLNRTVVREGASIRAAGDAILVEHEYKSINEYKPAGRVRKFYKRGNAVLIEFELYDIEIINDKQFLSVSWFSDNYTISEYNGDAVIEFSDIVIYEVSLVAAPAFNTCVAADEGSLACLSSSVQSNSDSGCGCGGKCKGKAVSLGSMVTKHQEVTREEFEALRDSVSQLQDALNVITAEIEEIKKKMEQPAPEVVEELEQAKRKLEDLEIALSTQGESMTGILSALDRLIGVAEKTYKNLPNIVQR